MTTGVWTLPVRNTNAESNEPEDGSMSRYWPVITEISSAWAGGAATVPEKNTAQAMRTVLCIGWFMADPPFLGLRNEALPVQRSSQAMTFSAATFSADSCSRSGTPAALYVSLTHAPEPVPRWLCKYSSPGAHRAAKAGRPPHLRAPGSII